jgi:hypothetical protein
LRKPLGHAFFVDYDPGDPDGQMVERGFVDETLFHHYTLRFGEQIAGV